MKEERGHTGTDSQYWFKAEFHTMHNYCRNCRISQVGFFFFGYLTNNRIGKLGTAYVTDALLCGCNK